MKKIIVLLFVLVLMTGCSSKKFDKVYINSYLAEANEEDGQLIYDFLQKTLKEGVNDLTDFDKLTGGSTISIIFENGSEKTVYSFLWYELFVENPDGTVKEYRINDEYLAEEFYPFISTIFDCYYPVYVQLTNGLAIRNILFEIEVYDKNGERIPEYEELNNIEFRYSNIGSWIGFNYVSAEQFQGELNDAQYHMIINDGTVKEEIYFFNDYVVFNNKEIPYAEGYGLNSIFY